MTLETLFVAVVAVVLLWALLVGALALAGRGTLAREVATFLPNLVALFRGLIADRRVSRRAKLALVVATVWVVSPIDLIPEFIPIAGPLDDAIVAALVLRYVLRSTDRGVLAEHWRGDPETLRRLLRLAGA